MDLSEKRGTVFLKKIFLRRKLGVTLTNFFKNSVKNKDHMREIRYTPLCGENSLYIVGVKIITSLDTLKISGNYSHR